MHIEPALAKLLAQQDGVVARWQVLDPATRARIDRRLASRRWQSPYDGVYVAHSGPPTTMQRRWAGLLAAGRGAALAGLTVLQLAEVTGIDSDLVHVAVPHKRHGPKLPGVDITRVRHFDRYVHPARSLPQLRLAYLRAQLGCAGADRGRRARTPGGSRSTGPDTRARPRR